MKRSIALSFVWFGILLAATNGNVTKTPYESFDVSIDFSAVASTITLVSCTAINLQSRSDSTADVIASSPQPAVNGTKVICRVQHGKTGEKHLISIKVQNPNTGELFEGTIQLNIS